MFLLLSFAPDDPAGNAISKLLERDLLFGGILLAEQRARCGERAGAVARLVHNAAFGKRAGAGELCLAPERENGDAERRARCLWGQLDRLQNEGASLGGV